MSVVSPNQGFVIDDDAFVTINLPYWDAVQQLVRYANFQMLAHNAWGDNQTDIVAWVWLFSWLNKLNPDWQGLAPVQLPAQTGLTGKCTFSCRGIQTATVDILSYPPGTDFWWNTDFIARFGVYYFTRGAAAVMPLGFLNCASNFIFKPPVDCDGLVVNFPPGVTGWVQLNADNTNSGATTAAPAVYWTPATFEGTPNGLSGAINHNPPPSSTLQALVP
jgi:hypothetical protein